MPRQHAPPDRDDTFRWVASVWLVSQPSVLPEFRLTRRQSVLLVVRPWTLKCVSAADRPARCRAASHVDRRTKPNIKPDWGWMG